MLKTTIKRLLQALLVLIGLSIMIFTLMRIIPGDPARLALGPSAPEEVVEAYREKMHYNDPYIKQYFYWLQGVLKGDFGMSNVTQRNVTTDMKEFLPATLELVIWAGFPPILLSLLLGVLGAMYKNRPIDYIIRFTSYAIIATPTFVLAALLLLVFGYWIPILPSIGGRLTYGITVNNITGLVILDSLLQGQFSAAGGCIYAHFATGVSTIAWSLHAGSPLDQVLYAGKYRKGLHRYDGIPRHTKGAYQSQISA